MTERLLENGYVIEPNPSYNLIDIKNTPVVFTNTAETVTHNAVATSSISASEINFSFRISQQFLSRTPVVTIKSIPLKFTKSAAVATATKDNFIQNFFDNFDKFAVSELGFANCVDQIVITIDGFSHTISEPSEILRVLIPYYGKDEVYKYIDHSLPDIHSSFKYNGIGNTIQTLSSEGTEFTLRLPDINTLNPFISSFNDEYGTRLPNLSWDGFNDGGTVLNASLNDVSLYLVPSFFNVPSEHNKSFYNINDVQIKLKLRSNWPNYLFCSDKSSLPYITDVSFNQTDINRMVSYLTFKSFIAPNYIESKRMELSNDNYAINYPMCEIQGTVVDVTIPKLSKSSGVNVQSYSIKAIPKFIVVYAIPKVTDVTALETPHNFARIDRVSVTLNGSQTSIDKGALYLYHMAKENGLGMTKEIALNTKGAPILIDVSNNLTLKTNSLIGIADSMKSLSLSVDLTNLNPDASVTYQLKTMLVYDTILFWSSMARRFDIIESFDISTLRSMSMHIKDLYDLTVKDNVVLGGSFWSVIGDGLKKVGKGAYNVLKHAITNKNGFRDKLVDAWNDKQEGGAVIYSNSNTVGGNYSPNLPLGGQSGGRVISNWGSK